MNSRIAVLQAEAERARVAFDCALSRQYGKAAEANRYNNADHNPETLAARRESLARRAAWQRAAQPNGWRRRT